MSGPAPLPTKIKLLRGNPGKRALHLDLDLHALRLSFNHWLKDGGVSLVDAQKLMHHSDPKLTANVYTAVDLAAATRAIGRLPAPPSLEN